MYFFWDKKLVSILDGRKGSVFIKIKSQQSNSTSPSIRTAKIRKFSMELSNDRHFRGTITPRCATRLIQFLFYNLVQGQNKGT